MADTTLSTFQPDRILRVQSATGLPASAVLPHVRRIDVVEGFVLSKQGQITQFTYRVFDDNNSNITAQIPSRMIRWTSSNAAVATITVDGIATAVGDGDTSISATFSDYVPTEVGSVASLHVNSAAIPASLLADWVPATNGTDLVKDISGHNRDGNGGYVLGPEADDPTFYSQYPLMYFNGTTCASAPILAPTQGITVHTNVRCAVSPTVVIAMVMGQDTSNLYLHGYWMYGDHLLWRVIRADGNPVDINYYPPGGMDTSRIYNVCGTYDAVAGGKLWIDGVLVGTSSGQGVLQSNANPWHWCFGSLNAGTGGRSGIRYNGLYIGRTKFYNAAIDDPTRLANSADFSAYGYRENTPAAISAINATAPASGTVYTLTYELLFTSPWQPTTDVAEIWYKGAHAGEWTHLTDLTYAYGTTHPTGLTITGLVAGETYQVAARIKRTAFGTTTYNAAQSGTNPASWSPTTKASATMPGAYVPPTPQNATLAIGAKTKTSVVVSATYPQWNTGDTVVYQLKDNASGGFTVWRATQAITAGTESFTVNVTAGHTYTLVYQIVRSDGAGGTKVNAGSPGTDPAAWAPLAVSPLVSTVIAVPTAVAKTTAGGARPNDPLAPLRLLSNVEHDAAVAMDLPIGMTTADTAEIWARDVTDALNKGAWSRITTWTYTSGSASPVTIHLTTLPAGNCTYELSYRFVRSGNSGDLQYNPGAIASAATENWPALPHLAVTTPTYTGVPPQVFPGITRVQAIWTYNTNQWLVKTTFPSGTTALGWAQTTDAYEWYIFVNSAWSFYAPSPGTFPPSTVLTTSTTLTAPGTYPIAMRYVRGDGSSSNPRLYNPESNTAIGASASWPAKNKATVTIPDWTTFVNPPPNPPSLSGSISGATTYPNNASLWFDITHPTTVSNRDYLEFWFRGDNETTWHREYLMPVSGAGALQGQRINLNVKDAGFGWVNVQTRYQRDGNTTTPQAGVTTYNPNQSDADPSNWYPDVVRVRLGYSPPLFPAITCSTGGLVQWTDPTTDDFTGYKDDVELWGSQDGGAWYSLAVATVTQNVPGAARSQTVTLPAGHTYQIAARYHRAATGGNNVLYGIQAPEYHSTQEALAPDTWSPITVTV